MKRKKNQAWKYFAVAALLLVFAAGVGWMVYQSQLDRPTYDYLQVDRGPMRVTLRESAFVEPEHRLNVTPPIPGRIDSVNVDNGVAVKQGQVLAWISSTDRAVLMDAARAAGGKEVSFWQDIYKPAPLIAPLDGYIISTGVVPGQVVVAAQTVFTMSDHLIVQAYVDETDLNHCYVGQPVDITFDSFPDSHLTGTVHQVAYDSTIVNNVTTYIVNIYLHDTPSYVRSGISANVFLLVADKKDVLRIPTDAITPDGKVLVVTAKDQPPVEQDITTGLSDGNFTEVVSGLYEGQWIARRTFTVQQAAKGGFSFTTQMPEKKMIVIENVTRTYQMGETVVSALRGVSLHIAPGEFVSLIGASGSGKSTLLHVIGLLDRPDSGTLAINGQDTAHLSDNEISELRSETIGFVFQQFHLLKRMTAFDNVALPLIYAKANRVSANPEALLERVGLGHRGHHKPNELSGGQQQRVAIARALIRRPTIVLADEPTGNLDSKSGAEIMALLRELHAEGLTIVLVTHEPSIAAAADRTIRMHDGQIVEDVRKADAPPRPAPAPAKVEPPLSSRALGRLLLLNLQQAARGLWSNKLRTCLSALGIIIGVAAVIVMLALGNSARSSVKQQIAALGSNRLVILPNPQKTGGVVQVRGGVSRLTVNEALGINGRVPTVAAVSGGVSGGVQAVYGHNNVSTTLKGVMPGYESIYAAQPTYGRFFTMDECLERKRVALLGTTTLAGLFGTVNPIGQTIEINHIPFTVIGVLPPKGSNGTDDADDVIVVPLQTAMFRVLGKKYVDWIDTSASTLSVIGETQDDLLDLTREWPHIPGVESDSYRVINLVAIEQALSAVTQTMSLMLASVAAISLVVGGIGIMNIMLVSVTERTREIGLRKALGARGSDIQFQFLVESVTLCLGGGFLGIATGWLVILIVGYFLGAWINPSLISILLSCGFSIGVGVGFGYWPAVLASKLDPIEALRYE